MTVDLPFGTVPPVLLFLLGGLLIAVTPNAFLRRLILVVVPVYGLVQLFALPMGSSLEFDFFGETLTLLRVDKTSIIFATIFHLAAVLAAVYGWANLDRMQQSVALLYPGSAIGAVFAGDLITLFVFWEMAAVTSVFLILAGSTVRASKAAIRYLVIQVGSGVLLLFGAILYFQETGSIAFEKMELGSIATIAIFLAFGIKSAFPLLHNWLQDSYPESTITGTLILSIFTTKMAVYALFRGFPGEQLLIWIGAVMTCFPVFFAVIENDLRRVLCYSLNNQVGFMVVGIGIGTPLALNGTASYVFCNIIFEGLLFMSMGAVLLRTGTVKGSELGGLYKTMPLTTFYCIIGAASISAFPLFAGFVSKGMIIDGLAKEHMLIPWLMLVFAAAGVFHHSGIKIPYFAFFAHDSGRRVKDAPLSMQIAMALSAILCVAIGTFPDPLYALLPYPVDYVPYTAPHVLHQLQLLLFSALAFTLLTISGIYPPELRSTNLDFDWFYRKPGAALVRGVVTGIAAINGAMTNFVGRRIEGALRSLYALHGPEGRLARTWPSGFMAMWIAILLTLALLVNYL